jgi:hypothetical protein
MFSCWCTFKTHGNGQKTQAETTQTREGVYVGGRQVEIGEEMPKHVSAHPSWTLSHCMFILCIGTIGSPQAGSDSAGCRAVNTVQHDTHAKSAM